MLHEIRLIGNVNKELIEKIQSEHQDFLEGIHDLYDSLHMNSYCRSYTKARIFYVGYTLAANNINFKLNEFEE